MSEKADRYNLYGPVDVDTDELMIPSTDGDWIRYSTHEKLLTKYNGVWEWLYSQPMEQEFRESLAKRLKDEYEDNLEE